MQKFEGIHFYVNVANFNEVVIDEESKNGKVNHSIPVSYTHLTLPTIA